MRFCTIWVPEALSDQAYTVDISWSESSPLSERSAHTVTPAVKCDLSVMKHKLEVCLSTFGNTSPAELVAGLTQIKCSIKEHRARSVAPARNMQPFVAESSG